MTITATTNATATGTLTNSAIVTASTSDPLPANNTAPTGVSFTTAAVAADPGWICTVATGGGVSVAARPP